MFSYIIRRILYAVPILFGVMAITFLLFFVMYSPQRMALQKLGPKAKQREIDNWIHDHGYDKPKFINTQSGHRFYDSLFVHHITSLAKFDFGRSIRTDEPIGAMIKRGVVPSLLITLPAFIIGFATALTMALYLVLVRDSKLDTLGTIACVITMSISIIVYVIFGQWVFANLLKYFPAFGFNREETAGLFSVARFVALPVLIMAFAGIGSEIRMYRAIFLEEAQNDYIRTAQAKGVPMMRVLFKHVFKNGVISLITLVVSSLPLLIMGNLIIEDFFGIPGLGSLAITAIHTGDLSVVMAEVYISAVLFLAGLLLTDICYAIADPRIRLS